MPKNNKLIYIAYADDDLPIAKKLFLHLSGAGVTVWYREESIPFGKVKTRMMNQAINKADCVMILLSKHTANSHGFFQQEIRMALNRRQELPEDKVFIIPALLEKDAPRPYALEGIMPLDLSMGAEKGVRKLLKGIGVNPARHNEESSNNQPIEMTKVPEIYISYAWGGESEKIADALEKAFQKRGVTVKRDKNSVNYKDSIKEFMKQLGQGRFVIPIISKKYLEAKNCMFELLEIAKHKQFQKRIFPIVLPNSKIYSALDRLVYINHWEKKIAELDAAIREAKGLGNLGSIYTELDTFHAIRNQIDGLVGIISDMNNLTTEIHQTGNYEIVFEAIMKAIKEDG